MLGDVAGDLLDFAAIARAGHEAARQVTVRGGVLAFQRAVAEDDGLSGCDACGKLCGGQEAGQESFGQVSAADKLHMKSCGLLLQVVQGGYQVHGVVNDEAGIGRQIIEQGGGLGIEIGDIPLDAVEAVALAEMVYFEAQLLAHGEQQSGVEQGRSAGPLEVLRVAEAAAADAEPFERGGAELAEGLAAGADLGGVDAVEGALGGRVKHTQAFDLVTEEVNAHGVGQVRRPDVHDAAATGERARLLYHIHGVVAGLHPGLGHLVKAHEVAHGDWAKGHAQLAGGQCLLGEGAGAGDDDGRSLGAALERGERGEALLARGAAPADALKGKRIGFGEDENGRAAVFERGQPL